MSAAPVSAHQALRQAAWRRTWDRLLREPVASAAERTTTTDTADDRRPLGAGARPSMHNEDHVSALQERDVAFEEDGRHEPTDA